MGWVGGSIRMVATGEKKEKRGQRMGWRHRGERERGAGTLGGRDPKGGGGRGWEPHVHALGWDRH